MLLKSFTLTLLFTTLTQATEFLNKHDANSFLSREKRANRFGDGENLTPSNYKRECVEEDCNKEEYLEAWENHISNIRSDASIGNKFYGKYVECLNMYRDDGAIIKRRRRRGTSSGKARWIEECAPNPNDFGSFLEDLQPK